MELASIETIRYVCDKYGFSFSKDLGQNFLIDPGIPEAIADGANVAGKCVLEIGPGIGTLTASLAKRAEAVCALELDRRLFPVLEETLAPYENAGFVSGDVLKTDLVSLANEKFGSEAPVCAVSNLPYCVTTPAILLLLGCGRFESVTVMIQKEAAKKLIVAPGDGEWCLFSALSSHRAKITKLFNVSKGCFYPQPKVDSTVLHMECFPIGTKEEEDAFENIAKAVFAKRRKTVRNALSSLPSLGAEAAERLLSEAEIDPARRGETLSVAELERISGLMVQTIQKEPVQK